MTGNTNFFLSAAYVSSLIVLRFMLLQKCSNFAKRKLMLLKGFLFPLSHSKQAESAVCSCNCYYMWALVSTAILHLVALLCPLGQSKSHTLSNTEAIVSTVPKKNRKSLMLCVLVESSWVLGVSSDLGQYSLSDWLYCDWLYSGSWLCSLSSKSDRNRSWAVAAHQIQIVRSLLGKKWEQIWS